MIIKENSNGNRRVRDFLEMEKKTEKNGSNPSDLDFNIYFQGYCLEYPLKDFQPLLVLL